ncbi:MAG TPA: type 1 glutamine amidotransferase domain-containing protein [Phycisphaerae bacterium]|nr:type 1 glutamine amidotransferase domain-containing protein [Phycisphaerae bacterium]
MKPLANQRVLIFVGDDYEDLELWYPKLRLEGAGAAVVLAGQKTGHEYRGKNGYPCVSDKSVAEVRAADFNGVVIPGGWMPDKLRRDAQVLSLVRAFDAEKKVIASICHGPWINISAGVVRGVTMTSTPGIKDDLVNAGANWLDQEVVVDRHHLSSRRPSDLPAFGEELVKLLAGSR